MDLVQRQGGVLPTERNHFALHGQHGFVQVPLRGRELAVDGPGARDVGDVSAVLAAGVDENHVVLVEQAVVVHVVDHVAATAAGDDGHVGGAREAVRGEGVVEVGFQVLFGRPGAAHGGGEGAPGDAAGVAHVGDLGGGFDGAQGVDEPGERSRGEVQVREEGGDELARDGGGGRDVRVDLAGAAKDGW